MAMVKAGVGREVAHEAIKEHAVAAALALRQGSAGNELLDRLAGDDRVPLTRDELQALLADRAAFVGSAGRQVQAFVAAVDQLASADADAAAYNPDPIL